MEYRVRATNLPAEPFLRGYLECAEWAGLAEDAREALELAVSPRWSADSLARAREDCEDFQRANAADLEGENQAQAGHDFHLTRNRHGAGFWDGGYYQDQGKRLTAAAHAYGETWEDFDADAEELVSR